jgi:hypothetical protein
MSMFYLRLPLSGAHDDRQSKSLMTQVNDLTRTYAGQVTGSTLATSRATTTESNYNAHQNAR